MSDPLYQRFAEEAAEQDRDRIEELRTREFVGTATTADLRELANLRAGMSGRFARTADPSTAPRRADA